MSELMRVLIATGEAKSLVEHLALRDDLCAHFSLKERRPAGAVR